MQDELGYGYSEETMEALRRNWRYSQACYPKGGPWFLGEEFVRSCAERAGLPVEAVSELLRQAAAIRSREADSRLVWHLHWHSRIAANSLRVRPWPWPSELSHSPHGGLSFLTTFPLFALVPSMDAWMQARGIDPAVPAAALRDIRNWVLHEYRQTGSWGDRHALWSHHLMNCEVFQLARLQFQFNSFEERTPLVLRNRETGEVVVLAQENLPVAADGCYALPDEEVRFTTRIVLTDKEFRGNPVRGGLVCDREISLPRAEWTQLFRKGDPMLTIHIPEDGPLTEQGCREGLRLAREFFPAQFPEFEFKGFQTQTWLLGVGLQELLPPQSNIVRFQSLFELFPAIQGDDRQLRERVFGDPDLPLDKMPLQTSLQRIVHEKLREGRLIRKGAGVIPR
jgi:hypothetical protein